MNYYAVIDTNVLLNAPQKGYGILIDHMLEGAGDDLEE